MSIQVLRVSWGAAKRLGGSLLTCVVYNPPMDAGDECPPHWDARTALAQVACTAGTQGYSPTPASRSSPLQQVGAPGARRV